MTCKDCVSYEVCRIVRSNGDDRVLGNSPCKHFKNKADFVEVVKCKDCKYWCKLNMAGWCEKEGKSVERNDFCSYGERENT